MRRLTKREAEALLAAVDAPLDELVAAVHGALTVVVGAGSLGDQLRSRGREATAALIEAGIEAGSEAGSEVARRDALWELVRELNECRELRPTDDDASRAPGARRTPPPPR